MKTLTVNGRTLVLEEDCPECHGTGDFCHHCEGDCGTCEIDYGADEPCRECNGTGILTHHYTPEQYKEITGEEWPEDGPVYAFMCDGEFAGEWIEMSFAQWDYDTNAHPSLCVIATSAGEPDKDWRPK